MRVRSRTRDREKAEAIVLHLVAVAGRVGFTGKVKLYKAFYFAHLYHLQRTGRDLTRWSIARMPYGPGIDEGEMLLGDLVTRGALLAETTREGPFPTTTWRVAPGQNIPPIAAEAEQAVTDAVKYVQEHTAEKLSEITHDLSRAWQLAGNGEQMELSLDLLTDEEFYDMERRGERVQEVVDSVFPRAGQ